jgi:hypothetical protein
MEISPLQAVAMDIKRQVQKLLTLKTSHYVLGEILFCFLFFSLYAIRSLSLDFEIWRNFAKEKKPLMREFKREGPALVEMEHWGPALAVRLGCAKRHMWENDARCTQNATRLMQFSQTKNKNPELLTRTVTWLSWQQRKGLQSLGSCKKKLETIA